MPHLPAYSDAFGLLIQRRRDNGTTHTMRWCRKCLSDDPDWFTIADVTSEERWRWKITYLRTAAHEALRLECQTCKRPLRKPARPARAPKPGWYASHYETHRVYGGPEGGGWWYDRSYLQTTVGPMPRKHAERYAARMGPAWEAEDHPGRTDPAMRYE
mgnify:CR=1 FL=1